MKLTKLTSLFAAVAFSAMPLSIAACDKNETEDVGEKIEERADERAAKVVENAEERAKEIRANGEAKAEIAEDAAEMAKKRGEVALSAKEQLSKFDKNMSEFEMKAKSLKGATLEQANAAIVSLKAEREQANVALTRLGTATAATWDQAKSGLESALNELDESYDEAEDMLD
tara:strand:+ start:5780 stop:6295 length:516 start_codon:yes stop_codon:yes gene_type:complete